MSTKKSPLYRVKDLFGSKEQLVDALVGMPAEVVERNGEEDADAFKKRLTGVANTKLLRLHEVGKSIKDRWGTKAKMVDALLGLLNRSKDGDYRNKLNQLSTGKLFAQIIAQERADKIAKAQKAAADKPKVKRPKAPPPVLTGKKARKAVAARV